MTLGQTKTTSRSAKSAQASSQALQVAQTLQESQALLQISHILATNLDLTQTLQQVVQSCVSMIQPADQAVIHLLDETGVQMHAAAIAHPGNGPSSRRLKFTPWMGIAGLVVATKQTINVADVLKDPRFIKGDNTPGKLRSLLVAPVISMDKTLGTLSVYSARVSAFSTTDEYLLTTLGAQVGVAIERSQLLKTDREQHQLAETLRAVSVLLSTNIGFDTLLARLLELIEKIIPFDSANILLVDNNRARAASWRGYEQFGDEVLRKVSALSFDLAEMPYLRWMAENAKPTIVPNTSEDPGWLRIDFLGHIRSWVAAPILAGGKVLGFFWLDKVDAGFYQPEHLERLAAFAGQTGLVLQNAQLLESLQSGLKQEKATRARLVQSEKLAALGRIVASVAHELNNPLQAIQNALYLISNQELPDPQSHADLQVALNECNRMADMIGRLRETYRPANGEEFEVESLKAIVLEVEKLISTHLRHNNITFKFEPDKNLPSIPMIRDQMKQVVLNISLNAVETMRDGGELVIRIHRQSDNHGVLMTFADNGAGIPQEVLPYIFDPFFTTKEGGTGLGLAISYDIVQRHGGKIDVESSPGQGTTFNVWLPLTRDGAFQVVNK